MIGYDTEKQVLCLLESNTHESLKLRTFKMFVAFSIGTLIKCLPLPYFAPCIKHADVNIEKSLHQSVSMISKTTMFPNAYHRQCNEVVLQSHDAYELDAREEP